MSDQYLDKCDLYQQEQEPMSKPPQKNKFSPSFSEIPISRSNNSNYNNQRQYLAPDIPSLVSSKNKYAAMLKNVNPVEHCNIREKIQQNISIVKRQGDSEERSSKDLIKDKKQRNKVAAKNSRDRKKLYIEILEERKREKEKLLAGKKKELEEAQNYYNGLVSQNNTMSNFAASRHQLIKRLEVILNQSQQLGNKQDSSEEQSAMNAEINKIIDNLRSRIGATGKQRIKTINQYFQQIINLSLPALHRYLMWSASNHKHLFSDNEQEQATREEWFKQLKNALNLTEEQKREIQNRQKFLQEQKLVLENLIEELKNVKEEIEKKSLELDDLIDEIRKILTPIQCAYFILFIEKNKYRKELNLCDVNQGNQEYGVTRKLIKRGE